jgi:threonine synthase
MRCVSTRSPYGASVSLCDAIAKGLAPDGGLYVPEHIPPARDGDVLRPFFAGEVLERQLDDIRVAAFDFPAPVRWLSEHLGVLELFHGPTAAFKDFGARFLAESLSRLEHHTTILVATSGDTGAAVGAAFHRRRGFRVVILYPDGRVSPRQAHQLGAFGDNVRAYRVSGTFDDCQRMVKQALQARPDCTSANSISLGRLLPQMTYYAQAALEAKERVSFVVPTGNLGNALACVLARDMGLPIERIVLATNANRVLPELLTTGTYTPAPAIATLANAMDVGDPSNLERLRYWHPELGGIVTADWVSDDDIRHSIKRVWKEHHLAACPHTACAFEVLRRMTPHGKWIVVATAHPAKFETVVEPLIGEAVPPPPALQALLDRPSKAEALPADTAALLAVL